MRAPPPGCHGVGRHRAPSARCRPLENGRRFDQLEKGSVDERRGFSSSAMWPVAGTLIERRDPGTPSEAIALGCARAGSSRSSSPQTTTSGVSTRCFERGQLVVAHQGRVEVGDHVDRRASRSSRADELDQTGLDVGAEREPFDEHPGDVAQPGPSALDDAGVRGGPRPAPAARNGPLTRATARPAVRSVTAASLPVEVSASSSPRTRPSAPNSSGRALGPGPCTVMPPIECPTSTSGPSRGRPRRAPGSRSAPELLDGRVVAPGCARTRPWLRWS